MRVATFKTETSKSAVLTACRGLGINSDIARYISSLVTIERGKVWSIRDMYYGNPKKNREPVQEFINIIDKYSDLNLLEAILSIEGLKSGLSSHASGVLCLNEPLENTNSYSKIFSMAEDFIAVYMIDTSAQLQNMIASFKFEPEIIHVQEKDIGIHRPMKGNNFIDFIGVNMNAIKNSYLRWTKEWPLISSMVKKN